MRRRDDIPLPSAERWLLSWSDFVTLLLALFAAMYAGASIDHTKSEAVARAVGTALGTPAVAPAVPAAPAGSDDDKADDKANDKTGQDKENPADDGDTAVERTRAFASEIAASLRSLGLGERVQVRVEGETVGIAIDAELLFREGDAALSDDARQLLTHLAQVLRERPHAIRVEGHTDSTPIANGRYASNWELSAARAAVVVRQLAASGIAEHRMSAVGMAANRPLESNDAAAGRARNRRVHLVLLK